MAAFRASVRCVARATQANVMRCEPMLVLAQRYALAHHKAYRKLVKADNTFDAVRDLANRTHHEWGSLASAPVNNCQCCAHNRGRCSNLRANVNTTRAEGLEALQGASLSVVVQDSRSGADPKGFRHTMLQSRQPDMSIGKQGPQSPTLINPSKSPLASAHRGQRSHLQRAGNLAQQIHIALWNTPLGDNRYLLPEFTASIFQLSGGGLAREDHPKECR